MHALSSWSLRRSLTCYWSGGSVQKVPIVYRELVELRVELRVQGIV